MSLRFLRTGPVVTSPVVSSRQGVIQVFVEWIESFISRFLARKLEWKKRVNASIYIFTPESPRLFFLPSFLKFHSSLPSPTPQRGPTVHLFQFKSAFKYLLNSKIENFPDFHISHCFLSSSRSSICWMKFRTRMLEKNRITAISGWKRRRHEYRIIYIHYSLTKRRHESWKSSKH